MYQEIITIQPKAVFKVENNRIFITAEPYSIFCNQASNAKPQDISISVYKPLRVQDINKIHQIIDILLQGAN